MYNIWGRGEGLYRVLLGKPEGKRPLGRPRHRLEDHIKIPLQEVECGGMDWIYLDQERGKWQALTFWFHKMQGIS